MHDISANALTQNILMHLYNSAVIGSMDSIGLIIGMSSNNPKNPRFQDLRAVFDELGEDKRKLFYEGVAAVAEFVVYRSLYFVETYNRFDAEENPTPYPHLSLIYSDKTDDDIDSVEISEYGIQKLGEVFKTIARSDEVRQLVQEAINRNAPPGDRP